MIAERWDASIDIMRLRGHLLNHVFPIPSVQQHPSFYGWSVYSRDGSVSDGWTSASASINQEMSLREMRAALERSKAGTIESAKCPTEICHGYLLELMQFFEANELSPRRARIICLPKGGTSIWHRDGPDNLYAVRLHVPIITNSECFFETESERAHLPADGGAYFIKVNRIHRVVNGGASDRFHLVMEVKDAKHITKFHQFNGRLLR